MFPPGERDGVVIKDLVRYSDRRGWLVELYRQDEIPTAFIPVMAYISMTEPGIARGPHEHREQADFFAFQGPSTFRITLWDNRQSSPTYRVRQVLEAGEEHPRSILIPPGVVHAYKNVGGKQGMVHNYPNRLFAGWGKAEPVDEIRYENDPATIFTLD